jgi:hypothetical protein
VISATKAMKKEPRLIITNKPEEKYTNILNEHIFDQTYRGYEEDPALHHKQASGKYTDRLNGPTKKDPALY